MSIYAGVQKIYENWGQIQFKRDMGTHIPDDVPPFYYINIDGVVPEPGDLEWYDFDTQTFTATDPRPPREQPAYKLMHYLSGGELWFNRCTATERAKVWALANGESVPGVTVTLEQRYRLAAFKDWTVSGEAFWSDDPEVVTVINALESIGLLAAGRAAEILGTP